MSARLYANENFHRGVVEMLREMGHDVMTTLEAGRSHRKIPDEEVVEYATQQSRAVLTFNRRDFIQLHKSLGGAHGRIVICHVNADLVALAKGMMMRSARPGTSAGSWCGSIMGGSQ
ncbi:MAG: DUF5615 family PIN-like protein [Verrucomicrobiales bacterium]|nr:DUF5615 family PIN-like protein [Verrucomicrobiales bacterium]